MPPKTHFSRQEAAEFTGFSAATLAKWGVLGKGPPFTKFGTGRSARVRYELKSLEEFMNSGTDQNRGVQKASADAGGHRNEAA